MVGPAGSRRRPEDNELSLTDVRFGMSRPYRRESDETDRLLALSDGVIAIAITLLALEIAVPVLVPGAPASRLPALVLEEWQAFLAYGLAFLVIGLYWTLHRRVFVHIDRHDHGLIWLNIVFLLWVAFVPYATNLFSTYPGRFGVMFFAGVLAATGLSLTLVWGYASRRSLIEAGLASRTVQLQALRFLASPVVFLVSIPVAAVDPVWGMLTWSLLLPINAAFQTRLVRSLEADGDRSAR